MPTTLGRAPLAVAWLTATLGLLTACTGEEGSGPDSPAPDEAVTTIPADPALVGIPGRLLVLDNEGAITTVNADGTDLVTLAGPDPEVEERTQPTWSPDGARVAWTERRADQGMFLVVAEGGGRIVSSVPAPLLAGYIAWGPDGSRIAMSGNDAEGNLLLAAAEPSGEVDAIDGGSPLYFDWAPDGSALRCTLRSDSSTSPSMGRPGLR